MKIYDKLVIDRIPEIIKNNGDHYEVEVVSNEVALEYLYKKLQEEVDELVEDKNLEEIADVIEVLFSIGKKHGYSEEDILNRIFEKRVKSGGFEDNIVPKKSLVNNG